MIDKKFLDQSEGLSDDCFEEKLTNTIMQETEQDYFLDQVAELNEDAIVLEPQSTLIERSLDSIQMECLFIQLTRSLMHFTKWME